MYTKICQEAPREAYYQGSCTLCDKSFKQVSNNFHKTKFHHPKSKYHKDAVRNPDNKRKVAEFKKSNSSLITEIPPSKKLEYAFKCPICKTLDKGTILLKDLSNKNEYFIEHITKHPINALIILNNIENNMQINWVPA